MIAFFLLMNIIASTIALESCYHDGLCLGHLIEVQESIIGTNEFNTLSDCLDKCRQIKDCKFASFNSRYKTCTFTKACHSVGLETYQYSNVECNHNIVIIAGRTKQGTLVPDPLVETLSLDSNVQCQETNGLIGGLHHSPAQGLVSGLPTICGGIGSPSPSPIRSTCYQYDKSQDSNVLVNIGHLQKATYLAGYAPWQDDKGMIITGGLGAPKDVQIVDEQGSNLHSWTLPISFDSHCMIPIFEANSYLLISGNQNGNVSTKTYKLTANGDDNFDWEPGTDDLATARQKHMCATLVKKEKRYIVVIGGESIGGDQLFDCEYLEFPEMEWKKCADLPKPLSEAQLIEDPESGDLILLGGLSEDIEQSSIYRLSDIEGEWILQDQTLQAARYSFSAMFASNDILPCQKSFSGIHEEL